jgi:hypothetical protein
MEMSSDGETETDQNQERGDWMNDKDAGNSVSRRFRNREGILFAILLEQNVCVIANSEFRACRRITIPKDAKIVALVAAQWNLLDDRGGKCRQQGKNECDEEDDGKRRCRSQHDGDDCCSLIAVLYAADRRLDVI